MKKLCYVLIKTFMSFFDHWFVTVLREVLTRQSYIVLFMILLSVS